MSMTQVLAPHLPYLRRYARALTGSQRSGDAHVRAALTALLAGDQSLRSEERRVGKSVDLGVTGVQTCALPILPYLRRYARALTGSQRSGDAHVRAALTALLAGDQSL